MGHLTLYMRLKSGQHESCSISAATWDYYKDEIEMQKNAIPLPEYLYFCLILYISRSPPCFLPLLAASVWIIIPNSLKVFLYDKKTLCLNAILI